jgi:hypothetical protein
MNRKLIALLSLACLAGFMTGCVGTLDGHSKMGMPFSKDKIVSRYERPTETIFAASKDVLKLMGALYGENTIKKTLEAKVDTRTVWIKVEQVDAKVSQVTVQARTSGGGADVDLASEVDKRIALQLK